MIDLLKRIFEQGESKALARRLIAFITILFWLISSVSLLVIYVCAIFLLPTTKLSFVISMTKTILGDITIPISIIIGFYFSTKLGEIKRKGIGDKNE